MCADNIHPPKNVFLSSVEFPVGIFELVGGRNYAIGHSKHVYSIASIFLPAIYLVDCILDPVRGQGPRVYALERFQTCIYDCTCFSTDYLFGRFYF
jgi:hypothetical protein